MRIRNVLSLFDGMRCGAIALERAGITYDKYFCSEIDKYAIKIGNKNYPNAIELGNGWTVDVIAHILIGINLTDLV